jgi:hypothetical protein
MRRSICGRVKGDDEEVSKRQKTSRQKTEDEEAASFLVSSVSKSSVSFRRKAASLETKKTGALGEDAGLFECFATVADYSAAPAVSASAAA